MTNIQNRVFFKFVKQMEVEELRKEIDELWEYLYTTRETGTYDK